MNINKVIIYQSEKNLIYVRTKGTRLDGGVLLDYLRDDIFTNDEVIEILRTIVTTSDFLIRQNFINRKIETLKYYIRRLSKELNIEVSNENNINISNNDPYLLLLFNLRIINKKKYFYVKSFVTDAVNKFTENYNVEYDAAGSYISSILHDEESKINNIINDETYENLVNSSNSLNKYNEKNSKVGNNFDGKSQMFNNSFMNLIDSDNNENDKEFIEVKFNDTREFDEINDDFYHTNNIDEVIETNITEDNDYTYEEILENDKSEIKVETEVINNSSTRLIFHYIDEVRDDLIVRINESHNENKLRINNIMKQLNKIDDKLDQIIVKINKNLKK